MAAPHLRMYSNITNVHTIYPGKLRQRSVHGTYISNTYPSKLASACKQTPPRGAAARGAAERFFRGLIKEENKLLLALRAFG